MSARREAAGRQFTTDESGNPTWQTAIYYVYDPSSALLWRVAQPWDGTLTLPPTRGGRIMVRGVKAVTVARQEDLVTISLVVNAGRLERSMETAVQVRN